MFFDEEEDMSSLFCYLASLIIIISMIIIICTLNSCNHFDDDSEKFVTATADILSDDLQEFADEMKAMGVKRKTK